MVESANLFGANVSKATPEMLDILRFEIKLAKVRYKISSQKYVSIILTEQSYKRINISLPQISMTSAQRKNLTHIYNPMSIHELQANYPYVNWLEYYNLLLQNEKRIDGNETVIVLDKNYLERLGGVMESTPKRTVANYFAWRLVFSGSHLLNNALDNHRRQFFKIPPLAPATRLTQCIKRTMNS